MWSELLSVADEHRSDEPAAARMRSHFRYLASAFRRHAPFVPPRLIVASAARFSDFAQTLGIPSLRANAVGEVEDAMAHPAVRFALERFGDERDFVEGVQVQAHCTVRHTN